LCSILTIFRIFPKSGTSACDTGQVPESGTTTLQSGTTAFHFDLRYRVGEDLSNPSLPPIHHKSKAAPKLKELEETGPDLLFRPSPVKSPQWRSFPTFSFTMASGMNSILPL
jgi:hypothetical protein